MSHTNVLTIVQLNVWAFPKAYIFILILASDIRFFFLFSSEHVLSSP